MNEQELEALDLILRETKGSFMVSFNRMLPVWRGAEEVLEGRREAHMILWNL